MWNAIKTMWHKARSTRQGLSGGSRSEICIRGQKWLGPAESLRIVEVDVDGVKHRLVLWSTKTSAQMLQLSRGEAVVVDPAATEPPAVRGAVC